MSSSSPLGSGLYFVDVLACLLFCLCLVLLGARFGREVTVPVDLPRLEGGERAGARTRAVSIVVRTRDGRADLFLDDEAISLQDLETRMAASPPPRVIVRPEDSLLARVIGAAHAAGVAQIELAYEAGARQESAP